MKEEKKKIKRKTYKLKNSEMYINFHICQIGITTNQKVYK